jgi:hypothetical protein
MKKNTSIFKQFTLGTETFYVNEFAQVYNPRLGRLIRMGMSRKLGYVRMTIPGANGKYESLALHRVVAELFVPKDNPSKDAVQFIDGNSTNCCAKNLRWCFGHRSKLKKTLPEIKTMVKDILEDGSLVLTSI